MRSCKSSACHLLTLRISKISSTKLYSKITKTEAVQVNLIYLIFTRPFFSGRFQHANAHARKVKEYFRKNTQKGYENLIFLLGDGLFCQQLW